MSQSASLYPITPSEFQLLKQEADLEQLPDVSMRAEIFEQNFEGLQFLLAKFFKGADLNVISEIFSPSEFLGEEIDYTAIEFEDDFDEVAEPLFYVSPEKVNAINTLLTKIDDKKFLDLYNADELNAAEVYPESWHNDESDDQLFNIRHLEEGLRYLKELFKEAAANGNYIFSFIE
jgi:hypothetical protein